MEYEDRSRNVYALFPGIDTTPFGPASASGPEAADDGWSAVPTRTIAAERADVDDERVDRATDGRRVRRRRRVRAVVRAPALWVAVALVAGAAAAAGSVVLAPSHSPLERSHGAASAYRASATSRPSPDAALIDPTIRSTERASHHGERHGVSGKRVTRRRLRSERAPAPVRTRTVTVSTQTPPPTTPASPSTVSATADQVGTTGQTNSVSPPPAGGTTSAGGNGRSSQSGGPTTSLSRPVQRSSPAGPTGRVSLIGAGTTPSG